MYWGKNHEDNACGPVFGTATNNRGELLAVDMALKQVIIQLVIVGTKEFERKNVSTNAFAGDSEKDAIYCCANRL